MKSRNVNKLLASLVMFVGMFCVNLTAAPNDVVNIPDDNFKKALNNHLGRGEVLTDITAGDMASISGTLNCSDKNINNIAGAEYLTNSNLTFLNLHFNNISDISHLSGLTNLTNLILSSNNISDISHLSGLTSLTRLNLHHNNISDISHLSGLTNLTYLYLYSNNISDISPLSGLTNLTTLWLHSNNISDISPLSGLTNLTYLYLYSNNISDISPLSGLTNLTTLDLFSNSISDISHLSGLTNLTDLILSSNSISDISPLSGLTNLTYLKLEDQTINLPEFETNQSSYSFDLDIKDVNGTVIPYSATNSYTLTTGTNNLSNSWSKSIPYGNSKTATFDGTVNQKVTYTLTPVIGFESSVKGSTLTWTIEEEIGVKNYVIKDSSGKIITTVIADGSSSYDIELPEGITDVVIEIVDNDGSSQTYAPEDGNKQITFYDLEKGWNLIAITADNADLTELKKSSSGAIWAWNGESYTSVESAEATNAVWVYMNSAKQVKVTGTKSNATIKLSSGWNLVGPTENGHIPEKAISTYSWDSINEMYQNINKDSILQEGVGYWIFSF